LAWDTLIYRDPVTNEYRGQLAKSWTWVDDKTLEVDLRAGRSPSTTARNLTRTTSSYTMNFVSNPANKVLNTTNVAWIAGGGEGRQVQGADQAERRPSPAPSNISPARW
jgi:peptide/nickel transport system substrate-binding protein